jgi:hypothetical protein
MALYTTIYLEMKTKDNTKQQWIVLIYKLNVLKTNIEIEVEFYLLF